MSYLSSQRSGKTWEKTALLVMDIQKDFILPDGAVHLESGLSIIPNINKVVEVARQRGILVIWTGKSKHFGFIEFESPEVAKIVADTMHNYLLFEHLLQVCLISPERVHPKLRRQDIIIQNQGSLVLELQQRSIEFNSIIQKHQNISKVLFPSCIITGHSFDHFRRLGLLNLPAYFGHEKCWAQEWSDGWEACDQQGIQRF